VARVERYLPAPGLYDLHQTAAFASGNLCYDTINKYPPDYCPKVGLTHWQPGRDATPPSPLLSSPLIAPILAPEGEKPKRS
jgi:hypothetical protein